MNATYISEAIEALQTSILMHVRHRTLQHYLGEPTLRAPQLFFIRLPFLLNMQQINEIDAVTVGIVHASLEEHDQIKEIEATTKEQQLRVLSGDYYSGRYYQLLAQTGNILLIQKLSQAIVTRCEHQITVYEFNERSIAEWIDSLKVIQTELITQYYVANGLENFVPLMQETLTIVRLQEELSRIKDGAASRFGKSLVANSSVHEDITAVLQKEITKRQQALQQLLENAELDDALAQYVTNLGGCQK
ncbi:MAG: heptaprenyl diphosphate synthase component 1 [Solibacillus sp.]